MDSNFGHRFLRFEVGLVIGQKYDNSFQLKGKSLGVGYVHSKVYLHVAYSSFVGNFYCFLVKTSIYIKLLL